MRIMAVSALHMQFIHQRILADIMNQGVCIDIMDIWFHHFCCYITRCNVPIVAFQAIILLVEVKE
jgi:hypothetical protein